MGRPMLRRISLCTLVLVSGSMAAALASPVKWTCPERLDGCMGASIQGERELDRAACLSLLAPADRPAEHRTATFVVDAQAGQFVNSLGQSGRMTPQEGLPSEYLMSTAEEIVEFNGRAKIVDDRVAFQYGDGGGVTYAVYRGACRVQDAQ